MATLYRITTRKKEIDGSAYGLLAFRIHSAGGIIAVSQKVPKTVKNTPNFANFHKKAKTPTKLLTCRRLSLSLKSRTV